MMHTMKHRLISAAFASISWLLGPAVALAASDDEKLANARLQNYIKPVTVESSSTALTWLLLAVLGVVCIAVVFKSAKRTHLD